MVVGVPGPIGPSVIVYVMVVSNDVTDSVITQSPAMVDENAWETEYRKWLVLHLDVQVMNK